MKSFLLASLALAGLTGCVQFSLPTDAPAAYVPANYRGDSKLAPDIQRIAVLPAHAGNATEAESAAAMDAVLGKALQNQARFEVVVVSREECQRAFGAESFASTDALPHGLLEKIAEKYAVDAVLFTDLTVYQAYRPISLGFRSKLATTRDVRLVWSFDEVFSASQPAMVASVRDFYRHGDRMAPVDPTPAALQSPARFGAVAADIMFRTLPSR